MGFSQGNIPDSLQVSVNHTAGDMGRISEMNWAIVQMVRAGDNENAFRYTVKLRLISQRMRCAMGVIACYNLRGMICRSEGDNRGALENYFTGLKIGLADGKNKKLVSNLCHNIARIYDNMGNYPKALEFLFLSLKIKAFRRDKTGMANTLGHIGRIYRLQGDPQAESYYLASLRLQEEIKNYPGITIALNDLGLLYKNLGDDEKALSYFFRSLEANKRIGYLPEVANACNQIGGIYQKRGRYAEALRYCLRAQTIYERLNDKEETAGTLVNIGQLYYAQNRYGPAEQYFKKGLATANRSGVWVKMKEAHEGLSNVYAAQGRLRAALDEYKASDTLRNKIFNDDQVKKMVRAEMNFEFEKKEQRLRLEEQNREQLHLARLRQEKMQRYVLLLGLAFLVLLGIVLFQRLRLRQALKVSHIRNKIASDLHDDVGSALSSISMFAGVARMSPDSASHNDIVDRISKTSRETIDTMGDIVWSIQSKNDNFLHVLEKMKYFGEGLMHSAGMEFSFEYNGQTERLLLDMEQRKNLYLIYKEAMNNAAKYSGASRVEVSIGKTKKRMHLRICDNGKGIAPELQGRGNGLQNMRQRAVAINGTLSITHGPEGKGTCIELSFLPD